MKSFFYLLMVLFSFTIIADTKNGKKWEKLENCKYLDNRANDGDSFHVECDREYLFRLYFIDTPESEDSLPERIKEQASYFNISPEDSLKIGKEAANFTKKTLSQKNLTVWTKWADALGRSKMKRYYAFFYIDGEDYNELLIKNGLARIHGARTNLSYGKASKKYISELKVLEEKAKKEKIGAWGL